jgi:cold shock CspA family protein
MQLTPAITFRGVRKTPELETEILTRLRKLETYYPRITGCRILVELLQRHHRAGNHYHVRIDLTVPGEEIVVSHEAGLQATAQDVDMEELTKATESDPAHKHASVAIAEAFRAARRRLQDYARRQRGVVKTAVRPARGRVSQLFPVDEYGYLEAEDGHEVYFEKGSVIGGGFDRLAVGSAVSFVEEQGEKGPQASTVRLLHPRRIHRASHATAGPRIVR